MNHFYCRNITNDKFLNWYGITYFAVLTMYNDDSTLCYILDLQVKYHTVISLNRFYVNFMCDHIDQNENR